MEKKLKLFTIFQTVNEGYDTYSGAVVIAEDEEQAKRTHPNDFIDGIFYDEEKKQFWNTDAGGKKYLFEGERYGSWTNNLTKIKVEYLGEAKEGSEKGVVCSSFHAG